MSADQARITILCSRTLKLQTKKAIANHNEEWQNDGYLKIFKLGLEQYKKKGVKNNDKLHDGG